MIEWKTIEFTDKTWEAREDDVSLPEVKQKPWWKKWFCCFWK